MSNCNVHISRRPVDHHGEEKLLQLGEPSSRLNNGRHVLQTARHYLCSSAIKLLCKYVAHACRCALCNANMELGGLHGHRCPWHKWVAKQRQWDNVPEMPPGGMLGGCDITWPTTSGRHQSSNSQQLTFLLSSANTDKTNAVAPLLPRLLLPLAGRRMMHSQLSLPMAAVHMALVVLIRKWPWVLTDGRHIWAWVRIQLRRQVLLQYRCRWCGKQNLFCSCMHRKLTHPSRNCIHCRSRHETFVRRLCARCRLILCPLRECRPYLSLCLRLSGRHDRLPMPTHQCIACHGLQCHLRTCCTGCRLCTRGGLDCLSLIHI